MSVYSALQEYCNPRSILESGSCWKEKGHAGPHDEDVCGAEYVESAECQLAKGHEGKHRVEWE